MRAADFFTIRSVAPHTRAGGRFGVTPGSRRGLYAFARIRELRSDLKLAPMGASHPFELANVISIRNALLFAGLRTLAGPQGQTAPAFR